ncbi:MAG TPA: glycoside hydrolase family 3 C-terminal domain-containing protein [Verrucomicrobiae bacterium]|nr:glycoside hydrolase family 3 C-terminal domain-containing protein [Verrucomicrobiae bacterium]
MNRVFMSRTVFAVAFFFIGVSSALRAEDATNAPSNTESQLWKDPSQSIDARVHDLVSRLTLEEKVTQIRNGAAAVPRLGIPAYDFWSEALHGVAREGIATVFPQAVGMAATWDVPLIHSEGEVIATEGRAKYNEYTRTHNRNSQRYTGLTFWSPNINIFRDPRWGRGQETYGEDPFLTGRLGVAFIEGVQGNDPKYFKAMACAKHYAVHSGPEPERHGFNTDPPERDFYETYLPQFEMAVREAHVGGVMGAYNSVYGEPACANPLLLDDILRHRWGFDGYIVSDCGAINDIFAHHKYVTTPEQAAAVAVKAGCDICCGNDYNALVDAVKQGLITEKEIDVAVGYALRSRFQLGLFDPPDRVPFSNISMAQNDTPENAELALRAARESIVLLKNDGLLPLNRAKIKRIAVIGSNADSIPALLGNYNGTPSHPITILDGLRRAIPSQTEISYAQGCPLALRTNSDPAEIAALLKDAVTLAKNADVVIYVGGISPSLEGEEFHNRPQFVGFLGGDRTLIELPAVQENLLKALSATGKPLVFVNCSGSAIAMPWENKHVPVILQAWYPGEQGGRAVADVLFGEVNPSGRLPVTFYKSTADLPSFEDYSMSNRTYRYFSGKPLFAFGHGLSYTKFKYVKATLTNSKVLAEETVRVTFNLKNAGAVAGDEVAQVYFRHKNSAVPQPKLALCGFTRVNLGAGETKQVTVEIPASQFRYWDTTQKKYVVEPGDYELLIGAASDDIRLHVPFSIVSAK